jgi:hypothetical protein
MVTLAIGIFLAQAPTTFDRYRPFEPILILLTFVQFYIAFRLRQKPGVESGAKSPAQTRRGTVVSWAVMLFVIACGIYILLYLQSAQGGRPGGLYGYAAIVSGAVAVLLAFVRRIIRKS